MHLPGLIPLLVVLLLAFLLFGKPGRLSSIMEDLGKGIKGFRKGMDEPEKANEPPARQVPDQSAGPSQTTQDRTQN